MTRRVRDLQWRRAPGTYRSAEDEVWMAVAGNILYEVHPDYEWDHEEDDARVVGYHWTRGGVRIQLDTRDSRAGAIHYADRAHEVYAEKIYMELFEDV